MGNKLFPWNSQPSPPLAEHQTVLFTMHSPTAVRTIKPKRRDCSFLVPTSAAPGAKFIRVVSVSPTTSPPNWATAGKLPKTAPFSGAA